MADPRKKRIIRLSTKVPYEKWVVESISELTEEKQIAILRAREHRTTLRHRGWWSASLMGIVILINIVSLFVVISIGLGWMHFDGDYAIPAIIGANFVETWALTKIAMNFYFNSHQEDKSDQL